MLDIPIDINPYRENMMNLLINSEDGLKMYYEFLDRNGALPEELFIGIPVRFKAAPIR